MLNSVSNALKGERRENEKAVGDFKKSGEQGWRVGIASSVFDDRSHALWYLNFSSYGHGVYAYPERHWQVYQIHVDTVEPQRGKALP